MHPVHLGGPPNTVGPQNESNHITYKNTATFDSCSSDCTFLDRTMSGDFAGSIVIGKRKRAEQNPPAPQAKSKRRVKLKQESPLAAIDRLKAARANPILQDT